MALRSSGDHWKLFTLRVFSLMALLERLYHSLPGKIKTAEQWEDEQHVKAPLREDNGTVWARKQPKITSDGVKVVKQGDKNPNNVPAIKLLLRYRGCCPLSAAPTAPFVKNGTLLSSR